MTLYISLGGIVLLYLNHTYTVWHKYTRRYHVNGISLGDEEHKQSTFFIPTERGIGRRLRGMRRDLTIRRTLRGRPRIDRWSDSDLYLVLSACQTNPALQNDYNCNCGHILAPRTQRIELLAIQSSPMDTWHDVVVRAEPGDIFMVQPPTPKKRCTQTYYLVGKDGVIVAPADHVEDAYRGLLYELGQQHAWLTNGIRPWEWRDICRHYEHHLTAGNF